MAGPPGPLPIRGLRPAAGSAVLQDGVLANAVSPSPSVKPSDTSPIPPRGRRAGSGGRWGGPGPRVPRQSASEREKLRMRRLAQALLRLRHYLPPALAPPGQSLTKIETLRLAIRYIAHLSALLGLSQGGLARRRGAAPRHCPLCPQGLGCCQSPDPRLHPPAPRDAAPAGTLAWGSPHVAGTPPELLGVPDTEMTSWGSPPYGSSAGTPPEMLGVPDKETVIWGSPLYGPAATTPTEPHAVLDMEMGAWGSPPYIPTGGTPGDELHVILDMGKSAWGSSPYIPATETPLELHGAVTSNELSWPSPPQHAGSETLQDAPRDPLLDAGLLLPELVDVGTVTQDLSMDLLSLLEALLPPQPRD